ncbi:MAG: hypothetical protein KC613_10740 [Myxococcales bacterium]|nr:hypothetical protein [Myxococcales bacterium]
MGAHPLFEICGSDQDDDCDGVVDERCDHWCAAIPEVGNRPDPQSPTPQSCEGDQCGAPAPFAGCAGDREARWRRGDDGSGSRRGFPWWHPVASCPLPEGLPTQGPWVAWPFRIDQRWSYRIEVGLNRDPCGLQRGRPTRMRYELWRGDERLARRDLVTPAPPEWPAWGAATPLWRCLDLEPGDYRVIHPLYDPDGCDCGASTCAESTPLGTADILLVYASERAALKDEQ